MFGSAQDRVTSRNPGKVTIGHVRTYHLEVPPNQLLQRHPAPPLILTVSEIMTVGAARKRGASQDATLVDDHRGGGALGLRLRFCTSWRDGHLARNFAARHSIRSAVSGAAWRKPANVRHIAAGADSRLYRDMWRHRGCDPAGVFRGGEFKRGNDVGDVFRDWNVKRGNAELDCVRRRQQCQHCIGHLPHERRQLLGGPRGIGLVAHRDGIRIIIRRPDWNSTRVYRTGRRRPQSYAANSGPQSIGAVSNTRHALQSIGAVFNTRHAVPDDRNVFRYRNVVRLVLNAISGRKRKCDERSSFPPFY